MSSLLVGIRFRDVVGATTCNHEAQSSKELVFLQHHDTPGLSVGEATAKGFPALQSMPTQTSNRMKHARYSHSAGLNSVDSVHDAQNFHKLMPTFLSGPIACHTHACFRKSSCFCASTVPSSGVCRNVMRNAERRSCTVETAKPSARA